jgi:hypothetical protein
LEQPSGLLLVLLLALQWEQLWGKSLGLRLELLKELLLVQPLEVQWGQQKVQWLVVLLVPLLGVPLGLQ